MKLETYSMQQKGLLSDVALIRPILVVLLVFYHAFAIYSGAWKPIEGFPEIPAYWWLDKLSFAFMLEMFVFVSGYVFGFQVRTNGDAKLEAKALFWGKFKRLMIPCMVFSLLYILLFGTITQPIHKTLYGLVNGVAHMWFLPMLFWCFVGVWVIEKLHVNKYVALIAFFLVALIPSGGLPLQLSKTMYYMFFFYAGYVLQRYGINLDMLNTPGVCISLIIGFAVLFPILTLLKENMSTVMGNGTQLIAKAVGVTKRLCQLIYSGIGVLMMLLLTRRSLSNVSKPLPSWIIQVGALCMGVYLLQQFILKGLYNYTALPVVLGPYWLPWVGFAITLVLSLIIAILFRKIEVGRFLIG